MSVKPVWEIFRSLWNPSTARGTLPASRHPARSRIAPGGGGAFASAPRRGSPAVLPPRCPSLCRIVFDTGSTMHVNGSGESMQGRDISRRRFLATGGIATAGSAGGRALSAVRERAAMPRVIDFHQHTNYKNRANEDLVSHQRAMGTDLTVLLPAGSRFDLDANAGRNESVVVGVGMICAFLWQMVCAVLRFVFRSAFVHSGAQDQGQRHAGALPQKEKGRSRM